MKHVLKAFLVIFLFVACYVAIMLFGYEYLYPYPTGILDDMERADNALSYKIAFWTEVDSDTDLYFTRSDNGSGSTIHVGTIDCKYPTIVRNILGESTSSVYFPANSCGYVVTSDSSSMGYFFGQTAYSSTTNTVSIYFNYGTDSEIEISTERLGSYYYATDFNRIYEGKEFTVVGYNSDMNITFTITGTLENNGLYK